MKESLEEAYSIEKLMNVENEWRESNDAIKVERAVRIEEWMLSSLVPIFKEKGDLLNSNSNGGIKLLEHASKGTVK